jgi:HMG (high mobility group) box
MKHRSRYSSWQQYISIAVHLLQVQVQQGGAQPSSHASLPTADNSMMQGMHNDKKRKSGEPGSAPKKVTSYNMFCSEMRETLRRDHMGMPSKDVEKMMGQHWAEIPPERKREYEVEARRINGENALAFASRDRGAGGAETNSLK